MRFLRGGGLPSLDHERLLDSDAPLYRALFSFQTPQDGSIEDVRADQRRSREALASAPVLFTLHLHRIIARPRATGWTGRCSVRRRHGAKLQVLDYLHALQIAMRSV